MSPEKILDFENGCSYNKWKDYGANPQLELEDVEYLNKISEVKVTRKLITPDAGVFKYIREMMPYEVRYFELIPI